MEFDANGLITQESILLLEEMERQANRNQATEVHNMERFDVQELGRNMVEHCLRAVSSARSLLEQEGALQSNICDFLLSNGYEMHKRNSNGLLMRHYMSAGEHLAERSELSTASGDIRTDIVVNKAGHRLELKTSAYMTPKGKVPPELFDKDLAYLEPSLGQTDLDHNPGEGLTRKERGTELVLFVADMKVVQASKRFTTLFGKLIQPPGDDPATGSTTSGIDYEIYSGTYEKSQALHVMGKKTTKTVDTFVVVLAYPSARYFG